MLVKLVIPVIPLRQKDIGIGILQLARRLIEQLNDKGDIGRGIDLKNEFIVDRYRALHLSAIQFADMNQWWD